MRLGGGGRGDGPRLQLIYSFSRLLQLPPRGQKLSLRQAKLYGEARLLFCGGLLGGGELRARVFELGASPQQLALRVAELLREPLGAVATELHEWRVQHRLGRLRASRAAGGKVKPADTIAFIVIR